MKFNLEAIKAWIAGLLVAASDAASGGHGLGSAAVKAIESLTGFDIPINLETTVYTIVGGVLGYAAVYFSNNKDPGTAPATVVGIPVSGAK